MLDPIIDKESAILEAALAPDHGVGLLHILAGEAPDTGASFEAARAQVDALLHTLSAQERAVLLPYFGLEGDEPVSLEEIGRQVGLNGQTSPLVDQALRKLREPERYQVLPALAD